MDVLWEINPSWMGWNSFLAVVPCIAIWLIFHSRGWGIKLLLCAIWLAFLPNSIYIMTDVIHFLPQWNSVQGNERFVLIIQYILFLGLGLYTYYYSVYSFERLITPHWEQVQKHFTRLKKISPHWVIVALNLLIALGVTMGRFLRTNSWYIITDPRRVISDLLKVFISAELLIFMLAFAAGSELVYHAIKEVLDHYHWEYSRFHRRKDQKIELAKKTSTAVTV